MDTPAAPASAYRARQPRDRPLRRLSQHDALGLEAFFLSLDSGQRCSHFGGDLSDGAILDYCRRIDWRHTKVIARTGAHRVDAVALISDIPPDNMTAELSVICPRCCDRSEIVGDLFDHAINDASCHRELIVYRSFAVPELIRLVRKRMSAGSRPGKTPVRLTPVRAGDG